MLDLQSLPDDFTTRQFPGFYILIAFAIIFMVFALLRFFFGKTSFLATAILAVFAGIVTLPFAFDYHDMREKRVDAVQSWTQERYGLSISEDQAKSLLSDSSWLLYSKNKENQLVLGDENETVAKFQVIDGRYVRLLQDNGCAELELAKK